ncbi:hypothetical protein [Polyangium spumosum]|uniref:hypothetical protein n=1 Tax=Polyangium spumosum TaxID=889282 RepID=UPI00129A0F55|nr:hypothetical protein [Polyangium spumosum]
MKALAVANEPEPFWAGADEGVHIERWKASVGFSPAWGRIGRCGNLNGSSGVWVERQVLAPLGAARGAAWITDCLDTYRGSTGGARRIENTYAPFAVANGLLRATFLPHPSENDIVREALRDHRDRLLAELRTARAEVIVTLGNAALRVFRELVPLATSEDPGSRLRPDPGHYGNARAVRIGNMSAQWIPLAHPAAPLIFQRAHGRWMAARATE